MLDLRSRLSSGLDVLRVYGPGRLLLRVAPWFARRRYLVFARDLANVPVPPPGSSGLRLAPAGPEAIPLLTALRPRFYDETGLRRRFAEGHLCFVARIGDRVVHSRWVYRGRARLPYLGASITLGPEQVFADEVYTVPGERRNGLHEAASEILCRRLGEAGYRHYAFATASWDSAIIRSAERRGYREIGQVLPGPGRRRPTLRGRLRELDDGSLAIEGPD